MAGFIQSIFYFTSFIPNILFDGSPGATSGSRANADINGQTFDYIVVGGGLTGLVVANRLSEDRDSEYLVLQHIWRCLTMC